MKFKYSSLRFSTPDPVIRDRATRLFWASFNVKIYDYSHNQYQSLCIPGSCQKLCMCLYMCVYVCVYVCEYVCTCVYPTLLASNANRCWSAWLERRLCMTWYKPDLSKMVYTVSFGLSHPSTEMDKQTALFWGPIELFLTHLGFGMLSYCKGKNMKILFILTI